MEKNVSLEINASSLEQYQRQKNIEITGITYRVKDQNVKFQQMIPKHATDWEIKKQI